MGEGLVTLNLINDVRWQFQKLNITRANIDCFVFEFFSSDIYTPFTI